MRGFLLNRNGEAVGGSRAWVLTREGNRFGGCEVGCCDGHAQVSIVDEGRGSRRSVPEHDGSGQEAGSCNGEVEVAGADGYGGLTGAAE